jgi:hypothetical protein
MAITRIDVQRTEHGANVLSAVGSLRDARDRIAHAKAVMETCIDGSNYTRLEELFGVEAGQGQTLYNLLAGVNTDMAGFNIAATIARIG